MKGQPKTGRGRLLIDDLDDVKAHGTVVMRLLDWRPQGVR